LQLKSLRSAANDCERKVLDLRTERAVSVADGAPWLGCFCT